MCVVQNIFGGSPMDLENISDLDLEADTPLDNEAVIKFQTCKDVH